MTKIEIRNVLADTKLVDIRTGEEMRFITYNKFNGDEEVMCSIYPEGTIVWIHPQYLKVLK